MGAMPRRHRPPETRRGKIPSNGALRAIPAGDKPAAAALEQAINRGVRASRPQKFFIVGYSSCYALSRIKFRLNRFI